jgi:hypothetical protein
LRSLVEPERVMLVLIDVLGFGYLEASIITGTPFVIVSIFSLAGSQACEGITWPIGFLFREIFLAMAFFSCSIAFYLYNRSRRV